MSSTLTIRTDEELKDALRRRARSLNKSVSEVAREILHEALAERTVGERLKAIRGQLDLAPDDRGADSWERELRDHNWRR